MVSMESTEGNMVGAKRQVRDRQSEMKLTERSGEFIKI